ncbi:unnamed protein product [Rotaria magnacalcarata]|uniref:Uncharacterized protein n=2 Tax=Rotaria magnacalcarata TaxID=392030 RepID=A0A816NG29_9BILA|nr:unnamed protein product [Rotaria magnacalcarata]CAF3870117.1 unnamed protein product [Rotaria magnacalcarata]CAF3973682.1 unnamed protein product [Rotaria magnacalcarata]
MDSLNCPLTCDIFRDPVIGQDGHTYERQDIIAWLQQHGTSPITREPMNIESLRPNHIVRKMIDEFAAISKKKEYQFRLNVDVRKTETRPWFQTFTKAIYKAEWVGRQGPPIVLIKIDGAKANREALFYVQLGCHPHIVRTFGLVESDINCAMFVQECAENGNLAELLQENNFKPIRNVLVELFTQIIDAMICLADNKIVHGGLACRNVLVFRCNPIIPEENLVKLTDFGLTQGSDLFSVTASSSRTAMTLVPIRYAAPEILRTDSDKMLYSEKSDVYSMGVLMWEACSYGTLPFASLADDKDVLRCKLRGDQLPRPAVCDEELWSAIVDCWRLESSERPTFKELRRKIMDLAHRSDSPVLQPDLEVGKIFQARLMPSSSYKKRLPSANFESHEDKIPCEYCNELVNFDKYIMHTQVCAAQEQSQVINEVRAVLPMQVTAPKTQLALASKCKNDSIEITVCHLKQNSKTSSSSTVYRIMTKSSPPIFKATPFGVNRCFSDFLGLHGKLIVKYLREGIILPALPENDSSIVPKDIIEQRRAQLERYLNRLVRNKRLVCDPDFLVFIELPDELPKMTNNLWRDLMSTSKIKAQKGDWFGEKQKYIIDLQADMRMLKFHFDYLYKMRQESSVTVNALAMQLNMLATCDSHSLLSSTLLELASAQEKLNQLNLDIIQQEFLLMNELLNEYILYIDMANCTFNERAKFHKFWLLNTETLQKKLREKKPCVEMEVHNLQGKVVNDMENFERISATLMQEFEMFEENRMKEFKTNINVYIKQMLKQQVKVLKIWEDYLPIANSLTVTD